MTELADVYVRLGIRLEPDDKLQFRVGLSNATRNVATGLFRQTPEILVVVEEGSIKAWVRAVGTIGGLIIGYGGLRDGLNYAKSDSQALFQAVTGIVHDAGVPDEYVLRAQKRDSVPELLRRAIGRMDKLERSGRKVSADDYRREITAIRRDIRKALALTDQTEQSVVVEEITREAKKTLPNLPPSTLFGDAPLALRPEDFDGIEESFRHESAPRSAGQGSARRLVTQEPLFRVLHLPGALRLQQV